MNAILKKKGEGVKKVVCICPVYEIILLSPCSEGIPKARENRTESNISAPAQLWNSNRLGIFSEQHPTSDIDI